jgi:hypothetical protein
MSPRQRPARKLARPGKGGRQSRIQVSVQPSSQCRHSNGRCQNAPGRVARFARATLKTMATLLIVLAAALAAVLIWNYYIAPPWTRDGSVRVQERLKRRAEYPRPAECRSGLHLGSTSPTRAGAHTDHGRPRRRPARFGHDCDGNNPRCQGARKRWMAPAAPRKPHGSPKRHR